MVDFKDLPDTSTPINASNLNKAQEVDYSTGEIKIGKWINGKNLYRKIVVANLENTSYNVWKSTTVWVPFKGFIFLEWAVAYDKNNAAKRYLPYYDDSGNNIGIKSYIYGDNFITRYNTTEFNDGKVYASIIYTKD